MQSWHVTWTLVSPQAIKLIKVYPAGDQNAEPAFVNFCDRWNCCELLVEVDLTVLAVGIVFFTLRLLFSCPFCPLLGAESCVGLALFVLFLLLSCCFSSVPLFLGAPSCFIVFHVSCRLFRWLLFPYVSLLSTQPQVRCVHVQHRAGRKGESPANRPLKHTSLTA